MKLDIWNIWGEGFIPSTGKSSNSSSSSRRAGGAVALAGSVVVDFSGAGFVAVLEEGLDIFGWRESV